MKNFVRVLKSYMPEINRHKIFLILMISGSVIAIFSEAWLTFLVGNLMDVFASSASEHYEQALSVFQLILIGITVNFIAWRFVEYPWNYLDSRCMTDFYLKGFKGLQKHSFRFFSNNFSGSLVKKINRYVSSYEKILQVLFGQLFRGCLMLAIALVSFYFVHPGFAVAFFVWAVLYIGGSTWYALWKFKYDEIAAKQDSKITGVISDSIGNYATVKLFASQKKEELTVRGVSFNWRGKIIKSWNLGVHMMTAQAFSMLGFYILLLYLSIGWWQQGLVTVGEIIFVNMYTTRLFQALRDIGWSIKDLFVAVADAAEMVEILEQEVEVEDIPNAQKIKITKGEIDFKKVGFSYGENDSHFKDFDLTIKAGEKLALVGTSGAGKSTIVKMLFRFYDIQKGEITIDGQNIAKVTQESLRKNISLVPQDPDLFHRTIRENIAYGKSDATKKEIIAAAKKAQAHEFISAFPNGYDTLVGERGVKLSGGEKQRIALARVVLEDAPILVLDEATSALDSVTEKEIQTAIETAMEGKTVIVIAHRLSTIKKVNRVLVLEHGEIIEEGSHEKLLKQKGKYAQLWDHQVGGFM